MSHALPVSPQIGFEGYRRLARDLQVGVLSEDQAAQLAARWDEFRKQKDNRTPCRLADAQLFLAKEHGFATWRTFIRHVRALERPGSEVSRFEKAVEAVVAGDVVTLEKLLRDDPKLARARSTREHRSTLLHYVSANGVEDFRQKTPANIVDIARRLLDAGADVNAESNAYSGRDTTVLLTATSFHPEKAGVQLALLELLLACGGAIDGPDGSSTVNACLRNGRGQAAEFLAGRGASLDLEGAAGVGKIDSVKALIGSAAPEQRLNAFAWACQFGRTETVEFLLDNGVPVDARLLHRGQTGLHWASYSGHLAIVSLLVGRGAPLTVKDDWYQGTPLDWALHGWKSNPRESFYAVVALLVQAGANAEVRSTPSDARMHAALRGESMA